MSWWNPVDVFKGTVRGTADLYKGLYGGAEDIGKGLSGTTARRNAKALMNEEERFIAEWGEDNLKWKNELLGTLKQWRTSPALRELLSPAQESRGVAMAAEAAQQGATAAKREATGAATAQGLGRAFLARQQFAADANARGATAGAAAAQNYQRAQTGAAVAAQYAQAQADITNQFQNQELARKQAGLESTQRYMAAKQAADQQRTGLLTTLAAAAVGGVGAGAVAGGLGIGAGAALGASIGGQLSGNQGLGAVGFQSYRAARAPNVYGSDPFYNYMMYGGPYQQEQSYNRGLQVPSTYNQAALPSSTAVAN